MARESKAKKVVLSHNVAEYALPKALKDRFATFDKMREWSEGGGRTLPPHVRLSRSDYSALRNIVAEQSAGKCAVADVRWHGMPIVSE